MNVKKSINYNLDRIRLKYEFECKSITWIILHTYGNCVGLYTLTAFHQNNNNMIEGEYLDGLGVTIVNINGDERYSNSKKLR